MKKYIITKSVQANSISEALKKEKTAEIESIEVSEDNAPPKSLGFSTK